jgi:magnesium-transporting ATPase (P-type)
LFSSIKIAISYNKFPAKDQIESPDVFGSLTLVGIVGICDFIRPNTSKSCRLCLDGGIQIVMLTGDRKESAVNVAQEIGLLELEDVVLTSSDLKNMSDLEVCSRDIVGISSPAHL